MNPNSFQEEIDKLIKKICANTDVGTLGLALDLVLSTEADLLHEILPKLDKDTTKDLLMIGITSLLIAKMRTINANQN